ncbi:MAG: nucleotidyltransferase domain-containing protein [Desulfurococcaceae archaeon TW002]
MLEKSSEYEELLEAVKKIVSNYRVDALIFFGSRARRNYKPWSDYDILITADFKEKYLDRIGKILDLLSDLKIYVEPHPYTFDKAIEIFKKENPTIVDALSEGLVLYTGEKFKELLKHYEELLKRGLRKTETSAIIPPST